MQTFLQGLRRGGGNALRGNGHGLKQPVHERENFRQGDSLVHLENALNFLEGSPGFFYVARRDLPIQGKKGFLEGTEGVRSVGPGQAGQCARGCYRGLGRHVLGGRRRWGCQPCSGMRSEKVVNGVVYFGVKIPPGGIVSHKLHSP